MRKIRLNLRNKWKLISIVLGLGFIITLVLYLKLSFQTKGPTADEVTQNLSKIILLPAEKPQITLLTDVEFYKTSWPDFYKDAQPGNLLIRYQNSSLLYDPAKRKILNVASYGVFNKPIPVAILRISFRFNGNEQYRALFLKRQIEEDQGNSAYKITEVALSNVRYKDDVIYLVNSQKKDLAIAFAKAIGDSPVIEKLEPNEGPTDADIIVAFRSME